MRALSTGTTTSLVNYMSGNFQTPVIFALVTNGLVLQWQQT